MSRSNLGFLVATVAVLVACQPTTPPRTAPPAAPPMDAATSVAPVVVHGDPGASALAPASHETAAAPKENGSLECVAGADPDLDKESPWHQDLGARLNRALPGLRACSQSLPSGAEAELTLRMLYDQQGTARSAHVVHSNASGCAVSECVKRELTRVIAPRLLIPQSSYDISLRLKRGEMPRRDDQTEVLVDDDDDAQDPSSCIDPAIAALSRSRVRQIVATTFPDLKKCYDQALVRDRQATGNVTFEFVIGEGGRVVRADARDATLADCTAIRCMLSEFRDLSFPAPVGRAVRVIYPINYVREQPPMALK
jgi:hypothetical protein